MTGVNTMPNDESAGLAAGDIRFYDNCIPALTAGDCLINVTQHLNPATTPPIDEAYAASQLLLFIFPFLLSQESGQ